MRNEDPGSVLTYRVERIQMDDRDVFQVVVWDEGKNFPHDIFEGNDRAKLIQQCNRRYPGATLRCHLTLLQGGLR